MATLHQLNEFTAVDFQHWISQRLLDAHSDDPLRQRAASLFAEFGILRAESAFDGLNQLFKRLKPPAQRMFHAALDNVLRETEPGRFHAEALKDVIALIGTTRAFDVLPTFHVVFGTKAWGAADPTLFRHALSTIKTLQTGKAAQEAAKKLATAKRFPRVFIFDAYEIMIAGQPDQWDNDLAEFSKEMHELYESSRRRGEENLYEQRFKMMFEQLLDSVPFYEIFQGIERLEKRIRTLEHFQPFGRVVNLINYGMHTDAFVADADDKYLLLKSSPEHQPATAVEREAIASRARNVMRKFTQMKTDAQRQWQSEIGTATYENIQGALSIVMEGMKPPPRPGQGKAAYE